jgi:imidazole glycerol-phosphate synthase subunit HisF
MKSKFSMYHNTTSQIHEMAKKLRHRETEAEAILWKQLKGGKSKFKFRRQHPIDKFIADFYCHQAQLVIEIDGGYHNKEDISIHDADRTSVLEQDGLFVLRYTNEEVINKIEVVVNKIFEVAQDRIVEFGKK